VLTGKCACVRGVVGRITFAKHGSGMLGVAYVKTPFGKVNASDGRNFWTVVLDSTSFSGPLGYFLPEFWAIRAPGETTTPNAALFAMPFDAKNDPFLPRQVRDKHIGNWLKERAFSYITGLEEATRDFEDFGTVDEIHMSGGAFEINSIPTFNSSGLRPGSTALRLPKMAMPLVDGAERAMHAAAVF
jgi:hypothetical protein